MEDTIQDLLGKTLTAVDQTENELLFTLDTGERFKLYHSQDCCESVSIEDIAGDLRDLVGLPLTLAEETSQLDLNASESGTWTFYRFATAKGYVTVRWYGASNGYYSESVDFERLD